MIGSIPTETPEQQARVDKLKSLTPEKIASMVVFLGSDAAAEVRIHPIHRLAHQHVVDCLDH